MTDSTAANPPRQTKSVPPRIEPSAPQHHGKATADQEIGTFMKVLARLDPLSGRPAAKPLIMPLSVSGAAPKATSQPGVRSRNQGRAAR